MQDSILAGLRGGYQNDFSIYPEFSAVVLSGGPCGGKTTFLAIAQPWLEDRGCRVAVAPEGASLLMGSNFSPIFGWKNTRDFQRFLLMFILEIEYLLFEMLKAQDTNKPLVLLCDRGALDAIAYIGSDNFANVVKSVLPDVSVHKLRERYKAVIYFVTAADGAEEFFTLENNAQRTETPAQARELDKKTRDAWMGHQHLRIIDNSTDFDGKIHRGLMALARVLNMPEPREIERKFVVQNFWPSMIPQKAVAVSITQDYLVDEGSGERRVRMRSIDGSTSYYFTNKKPTEKLGERIELERQISKEEYEKFLEEKDPLAATIKKVRHSFEYEGYHQELDVYESPYPGLAILEIEVADIKEEVNTIPGWELTDVTGLKQYSNHSIALGLL